MAGVVSPPRTKPSPLTLVNSAIAAETFSEDDRWEMGFKFAPEACDGGGVFDPCESVPLEIEARPAIQEVEPFGVWTGDRCSAFGFEAADYEGRARRLLEKMRSQHIAREFWTGEQAIASGWPNQYLTDSSSDTVTDGASAVIDVLACLEGALASCGGNTRGMIHATAQLVTHWAALGPSVLRREGGMLLTVHDTIIVEDGGYDGSGPGGVPASNSQWAYATGLVEVKVGAVTLTPEEFGQALDRSLNTVEFRVWQPAAVAWDGCCHFAAEADLAVCAIGGVS